jgi:hypothetical protein
MAQHPAEAQAVLRLACTPELGASHVDSIGSERQRGPDAPAQTLGSGGGFLRRTARWLETLIEPHSPVTASVDRLGEVDYLSQALGDL